MQRELLVIARDRRDLYERLQRLLPQKGPAEILLDRRVSPAVRRPAYERRVRDISAQLAAMGYVILDASEWESA